VTGAPRDPWADPTTPTEQGAPYAGPPPTAPYPYPYAGGYPAPYAPPPYGYPMPWGPPRPRRLGQVVAAAVLSFVQAAIVAFASLYLWMILSFGTLAARRDPSFTGDALITEGTVLAIVQAVSVVLLILGGVAALTRRSRAAWLTVLAANAVQVVLAVYWALRLNSVLSDIPGPSANGAFTAFTFFFAAAPLVAIGLVVFGPGRRWFDGTPRV
jgi:hypothetical protein